ncbi:PREDICTED: sarcoplasmic reticulum histidine-rich calcium-binding protein [Tarenaya hassleriana]|uniref:sarcoplasmic reticulum histidine-rich calcium-binding protein n=1 Tax=Tarenaya hassleriana TaxID=28532 RepID=UPI00053C9A93|nr:PREDICTED: sarcoplasmic reticulum histidine-rich calcium-binding protein [Tarenaya hassleriana]
MSSSHVLEFSVAGVSRMLPEMIDPDGLMSCTECLGFESYDETRVSDGTTCHAVESGMMACHAAEEAEAIGKRRREENTAEREKKKTFPPLLTSLADGGGRRWFNLRQVRRDGRLEISQVSIQRPEILRTSRENGRLRLDLVEAADNPASAYDYNFQDLRDSQDECDDQEFNNDVDTSISEHLNDDDDDDGDGDGDDDDDIYQSPTHQKEIDEDGDSSHGKSDHIVDLCGNGNVDEDRLEHENNTDDDDDDDGVDEEWRYKTYHEVVMSSDHHHDHDHHHHPCHPPYHHNHSMQLWRQRYVTTR